MEVELVALGALHHPQAMIAWVREHATLLPLNLSQSENEMCLTDLPHRPF